MVEYLRKERQEDTHPWWRPSGPVSCPVQALFPSRYICVPVARSPFHPLCPSACRSPTCGEPAWEEPANEGTVSGLRGGEVSPRCLADRPCQGLRLPVNITFVSVRIPGVLSPPEASARLGPLLAPRPAGLKKGGEGHSHHPPHLWVWGLRLPPSSLVQASL